MERHILEVGQAGRAGGQRRRRCTRSSSQLLGRLHFRTSYGQNVLQHSMEVAYLCGMMADELGLDGELARRCGLLHDIGKAVDHEMEGGHPQDRRRTGQALRRDAARRCSTPSPATTTTSRVDHIYTVLVAAADAISASRPGARRETLEKYVKRLEELEELACGFPGVEQAYAIQAGREVRVIVDADQTRRQRRRQDLPRHRQGDRGAAELPRRDQGDGRPRDAVGGVCEVGYGDLLDSPCAIASVLQSSVNHRRHRHCFEYRSSGTLPQSIKFMFPGPKCGGSTMDALAFVEAKKTGEPQPVYVLAGAERFLKLQALERIQRLALGESGDDFARSSYAGDAVDLATVRDELSTLPFLSPRRLVIVQDADGFITKYRDGLEDYVAAPSRSGVLVLDVKSWKTNTRLAKALPDAGLISCGVPERNAAAWVRSWLTKWATLQYDKKLEPAALNLLLELVGHELGVLDQELAKLATNAGTAPVITAKDVDQLVGHSREENVWNIFDAIAQGQKAKALAMLHHLLDHGQEPIGLLGALGWQLRRLAQAARLQQQGVPVGQAVQRVGLFKVEQANQLLRHLGPRALRLYDWLLEADLRMKSSADLPARTLLERLVVRLAE